MVRAPCFEVARYGGNGFVVERDVVRVDAENLGPAFTTSGSQSKINISKSLINLSLDVGWDTGDASFRKPTTCHRQLGVIGQGRQGCVEGICLPTLTGTLYGVSNAHGLTIREIGVVLDTNSWIVIICEVCHGKRG